MARVHGNQQCRVEQDLTCTSGLNPFAQTAGTLVVSQDCIDAITSNQADRQANQQYEAQLNIQGALFDLPAGEVRSAFGVSWRSNSYHYTPDSIRESDYIWDSSAGQFAVGYVDGEVDVKEIYGEFLIPLLKDLPAARSLELELGAHSQYHRADVRTGTDQLEPISGCALRRLQQGQRHPTSPSCTPLTVRTTPNIGTDPCSATMAHAAVNVPTNRTARNCRLCSAHINAWRQQRLALPPEPHFAVTRTDSPAILTGGRRATLDGE
jgi:hypothetical protein